MKLAYYYHIPAVVKNNRIYLPGYFGVFMDALANVCNELFLVLHEAKNGTTDANEADYELKANNIKLINLGYKKPAWHRTYFPGKTLKNKLLQIHDADAFIVRSPTPLAPCFQLYFNEEKIIWMVVGDYAESVIQTKSTSQTIREKIINAYLLHFDRLYLRQMKRHHIMANSPALFNKYESIALSTHLIKTTTLADADFYVRQDTCDKEIIRLLYTGRIDLLKGLRELIGAVAEIKKTNNKVVLDIVGWENDKETPVTIELQKLATKLGVDDIVIFHGKKKIGEELNGMYRQADIYLIPSYEEGFPRTIWEAMANSLPVIATNVGAIPYYLKHAENAIIIDPKSEAQIISAINHLIQSPALRQTLIGNGMALAKQNTLNYQANYIINLINTLRNK